MFSAYHSGNKNDSFICVRFGYEVPGMGVWYSTVDVACPSAHEAAFKADAVRTLMHSQLQRIRQEAYENGWKDAKAKRAKRKWFFSGWGRR